MNPTTFDHAFAANTGNLGVSEYFALLPFFSNRA